MRKKCLCLALTFGLALGLTACGGKDDEATTGSATSTVSEETKDEASTAGATETVTTEAVTETVTTETATGDATKSIDYMALVNKLNPLPDGWEAALETVHITNSRDEDVEVEKKAYDAYLKLKEDLEKNDKIFLELDSARRSVAEQQDIMNRFIEQYGADYAAKTVATPGYSEHHTGLALDLYFRVDGKDVYHNEDMLQYPEIWEKIHAKLADYGFILRYPEGKEHITGYGYEPWHLRYIDNVDLAKEITEKGITLEEYLGTVKSGDVQIDLGKSDIFDEEQIQEAMVQIKCKFAAFDGAELRSIGYAGDETDDAAKLAELNKDKGDNPYSHIVNFRMDFHSGSVKSDYYEADKDYTEYVWTLGYTDEGSWDVISYGEQQ